MAERSKRVSMAVSRKARWGRRNLRLATLVTVLAASLLPYKTAEATATFTGAAFAGQLGSQTLPPDLSFSSVSPLSVPAPIP